MDNVQLGIFVTISGMGIVFFSLFLLSIIMAGFSLKKKKKFSVSNENESGISDHILVVIAAACTAALETDFEIKKITLIKERRITNSLWAFIGRVEALGNTFKGDKK